MAISLSTSGGQLLESSQVEMSQRRSEGGKGKEKASLRRREEVSTYSAIYYLGIHFFIILGHRRAGSDGDTVCCNTRA